MQCTTLANLYVDNFIDELWKTSISAFIIMVPFIIFIFHSHTSRLLFHFLFPHLYFSSCTFCILLQTWHVRINWLAVDWKLNYIGMRVSRLKKGKCRHETGRNKRQREQNRRREAEGKRSRGRVGYVQRKRDSGRALLAFLYTSANQNVHGIPMPWDAPRHQRLFEVKNFSLLSRIFLK